MSNFDVIHTIRESVQKGRTVLARVLFGRRSTAWQLPGNPRGRGNHCPLACDASHCQQVVWQGAVSCSEQFFSALHCPPMVGVGIFLRATMVESWRASQAARRQREGPQSFKSFALSVVGSAESCTELAWVPAGPSFRLILSPRQRESLQMDLSPRQRESLSMDLNPR